MTQSKGEYDRAGLEEGQYRVIFSLIRMGRRRRSRAGSQSLLVGKGSRGSWRFQSLSLQPLQPQVVASSSRWRPKDRPFHRNPSRRPTFISSKRHARWGYGRGTVCHMKGYSRGLQLGTIWHSTEDLCEHAYGTHRSWNDFIVDRDSRAPRRIQWH